ncbi:MAG: hypothetical protein HLUCCX21_07650, partial [Porphyrobacter sp. HL-46]
DE